MIKYLYFLILLLLINHCSSTGCGDYSTSADCSGKLVISDSKLIKCEWEEEEEESPQDNTGNGNRRIRILVDSGCIEGEQVSSCSDASTLEGVTNEQCLILSTDDYKCYFDGEKCAQASSCGTVVETKYEETGDNSEKLAAICNLFEKCIPDGNKCKASTDSEEETEDVCNTNTVQDECTILSKEKKLIICKWVSDGEEGKKCQLDKEITSCSDAATLNTLTNAQCSILTPSSGKYCLKGDDGCIEPTSCADIKVEVSEAVCNEFTKLDDEYQCVKNDINGCTTTKALCTDTTSYTYSQDICEKLGTSADGNKCYSDGEKCVEASSCGTVLETKYEDTGDDLEKLTAICNLFENCVPNGKKCKTTTDSEEEEEEESTKTICSEYTTEADCNIIVKDDKKLIKCIWKVPSEGSDKQCLVDSEYETCDSAKELTGVTDDQCKDLTLAAGNYCIGGPSGCIEVSDCDDIEANIDEKVCERIEPSVTYKTCTKKEEGAGCEAIGKSCTTEFDDYSSVDCNELTPSIGYTCYNTGEKCKEANACLGVEVTTLTGDDLTAFCKKFGDKCVPDGNKCKIESICPGKEENDCKLTLDSNILFDCEWDAESTPSCKEGTIYETCESAKSLSKATSEQCSALAVGDNQKCVKGDNGCEVVVEEEDDDDDGKTKGNSSTWLVTATIMNLVLILAF